VSAFRDFLEGMSKRRRGLLRLLAVVAVNAVVFVGVTHRLANKQERLASERERLVFELEQKKRGLEEVAGKEVLLARNAEAVERFWTEVVQERSPGLTEAWDEIDRLASEVNVTRGRTGYDREILDVGLEQIRATMPVEGTYFDLVRFLNRLERSPRFFVVEEVRLSQTNTGESVVRLECRVAFYLKGSPAAEVAGP
jgi:Tfp pilus assembly protein PilO